MVVLDECHQRLGLRFGSRTASAGDVGGGPAAGARPILLPVGRPVAVQVHAVGIGTAEVIVPARYAIRIQIVQNVQRHVGWNYSGILTNVCNQLIGQFNGIVFVAAVHTGNDKPFGWPRSEPVYFQRPPLDRFADGNGPLTEGNGRRSYGGSLRYGRGYGRSQRIGGWLGAGGRVSRCGSQREGGGHARCRP